MLIAQALALEKIYAAEQQGMGIAKNAVPYQTALPSASTATQQELLEHGAVITSRTLTLGMIVTTCIRYADMEHVTL
jgi:hypothetical protein